MHFCKIFGGIKLHDLFNSAESLHYSISIKLFCSFPATTWIGLFRDERKWFWSDGERALDEITKNILDSDGTNLKCATIKTDEVRARKCNLSQSFHALCLK